MGLKQVFSLEVFHSFFEEGKCNCLVFNPSPATLKMLNKSGFLQKNKLNGFEMYFQSDTTLSQTLGYLNSVSGSRNFFEFEIVNKNPDFYFFTELPVNWLGQLVYNSQTGAVVQEEGGVQLDPEFLKQESRPRFGTLRIYFETILNSGIETNVTAFRIVYQARATRWNYYIVNQSSLQLSNPGIFGKSGINFEGPKTTTIQTGQSALLFSSGEELLPLSERPKFKFDLVNRAEPGNGKNAKSTPAATVFKGLPNPDPGCIGIEQINGKKLVTSPIYVYI